MRAEALAACAWAEAVAGDAAAAERLLDAAAALAGDGGDLLQHAVEHARALALIRRARFADAYAPSVAAGEAAERARRPDLSYGAWVNAACAAACAGDFDAALEFVDRGTRAVAGHGLGTIEFQYLAARAFVLVRLGRFAEAVAAADAEGVLAERLGTATLEATAAHDRGMVALAAGDPRDRRGAARRPRSTPARRSAARSPVSPGPRRSCALGRLDEAEGELRATALEPVGPSDFPDTLVPRLTRLQGLVAAGRGDHVLAAQRLEEAAAGWRRRLARGAEGDAYTAVLADLGRPPAAGLVEPARELERALADLGTLTAARA